MDIRILWRWLFVFWSYACVAMKIKKTNNLQPVFRIHLNEKELALLSIIQIFFFGSGHINSYEAGKSKSWVITKRSDLFERVIPHFKKYSLIGHKLSNFNIWCEIVTLMINGVHLTPQGLGKILDLKGLLNKDNSGKDGEILRFNRSDRPLQAAVFSFGESRIWKKFLLGRAALNWN